MNSLIFSVSTRFLRPLLWILALWFLFRGHNAPGGGFIGGLIASTAVILKILSKGWKSISPRIRENLFGISGFGLGIAVISGMISVFLGNPFMTGHWITVFGISLGSPVLFDVGVFIVVFAFTLICSGLLLEEEEDE